MVNNAYQRRAGYPVRSAQGLRRHGGGFEHLRRFGGRLTGERLEVAQMQADTPKADAESEPAPELLDSQASGV